LREWCNMDDRLLYVISARRRMPFASFRQVFDGLFPSTTCCQKNGIERAFHTRQNTFRAMGALAHCDFAYGGTGSKVLVTSPALVRLPQAGLPQAILVGARSPATISRLEDECEELGGSTFVECKNQHEDMALTPCRVTIHAASASQITRFALKAGLHFDEEPVAWSLLCAVESLGSYIETLTWSNSREPNWDRMDFNPEKIRFEGGVDGSGTCRLSYYQDSSGRGQIHLLWKGGNFARIDRDWGRYAVLNAEGVNVLAYDKQTQAMAIPVGAPLPGIFSRTLSLCSGYAPRWIGEEASNHWNLGSWGYLVYRDIPRPVAGVLSQKLGQTLLPFDPR
jgi:hypothetical protein